MLKATVLSAVQAIRTAIEDLVVGAVQTKRTYPDHVPGTAPTPTDVSVNVSVYISKYREKEVDRDRVLATDYQAIVLPIEPADEVTMDVNDLLVVSSLSKTFRVVNVQKIMAGDKAAIAIAQIRI